jgi:predicted transcriptional regulator
VNATLKRLLSEIGTGPEEDQEALAEYARELRAARTGVYVIMSEEEAAIEEGLAQADRCEFASDAEIAALLARYRV